jgi:phosphoenolpyruvate carboxylase
MDRGPHAASSRETARLEIPEALRREVRMLGELLGQVMVEDAGEGLLADVERLRRSVIAARGDDDQDRAAGELVASWPLERAEQVARAFTCYFHLVNLAEERHRARVLRERDTGGQPLRDSLRATVAQLRAEHGEGRLRALLGDLELHPVLTAHPTEARRRAVVSAIARVGAQLDRLEDPRCSAGERGEARRRLLEEIDVLWRTAQLRRAQVRPLDEVGPVSATLALYEAQARLAAWAERRAIRLTLFHGRGGALGRGGGPANRAVLAQAPGSVAGRFKVTEQGEVIFARYGNAVIARRHLEQVASAVLVASSPRRREAPAEPASRYRELARTIDSAARSAYRALVETEGFAEWFARVSPLEELGRLRIGSRPARRAGGRRLEDLRAIPWVFAWAQTRLNLPGWYGLGSGLAAAELADLRGAYAEWAWFGALLDNAEMSLAKTDRRIAVRYLALGGRPDLEARVLAEYDLTAELVLAVTGHRRLLESRRVLSWAVQLRNPYVDALSHLQLRALRALRAGAGEDESHRLERLLLLTINGVAAGLQNTG